MDCVRLSVAIKQAVTEALKFSLRSLQCTSLQSRSSSGMRSANPDAMTPVTVESDHLGVARDVLHATDMAYPDFFD